MLLGELEETRERYAGLKRQDSLFRSVRNSEEEEVRVKHFREENSVVSVDDSHLEACREWEAKVK